MSTTKLSLIAAACENMGIGKNGDLPWQLKTEMAYFTSMTKRTLDPTKKNAVIMGRKTWDSISDKHRPLNGRVNVVLTRSPENLKERLPQGVMTFKSLNDAITSVENNSIERIWIIGGTSVYKEAMEHQCFHRIYLTEIMKFYDCDTFFPKIDDSIFYSLKDYGQEAEHIPKEKQTENGIDFYYKIYEKRM